MKKIVGCYKFYKTFNTKGGVVTGCKLFNSSLSPIWRGFASGFIICKKECTRLAAASDKDYQSLAQGRWFSLATSASSTTKTGCHDDDIITEILLKVALNTINKIKSNQSGLYCSDSKQTWITPHPQLFILPNRKKNILLWLNHC